MLEKIKKITPNVRRDEELLIVSGTPEQLADVRAMLDADGYVCDNGAVWLPVDVPDMIFVFYDETCPANKGYLLT